MAPKADVSEDADMNPPSATQDDDDSNDEAHERFVTMFTTAWSRELSKPHEGIAATLCLPLIPNNVGYSTKAPLSSHTALIHAPGTFPSGPGSSSSSSTARRRPHHVLDFIHRCAGLLHFLNGRE